MTRIKRGSVAKKYRKKILKFNKGFVGSHSVLYRTANQQHMRALRYSYFDRRKRKRGMRRLWIKRINAAVRLKDFCYSDFICKLKQSSIVLNRKILSQLCLFDLKSFDYLLNKVSNL
jgi:large subunit ribosomal protein L20|nr:ribosomal protein L20 [Eutreptiella sp. CCMP1594]